jgi:metal-sulfur cluster biosynthetic enzyme
MDPASETVSGMRRLVADRLRDIIDPEIGVNIVDLGLVYAIELADRNLVVRYSTTTPGCPLRRFIEQQIITAVRRLDGVDSSEVVFVTDPSWSPDMVSGNVTLFAGRSRGMSWF